MERRPGRGRLRGGQLKKRETRKGGDLVEEDSEGGETQLGVNSEGGETTRGEETWREQRLREEEISEGVGTCKGRLRIGGGWGKIWSFW